MNKTHTLSLKPQIELLKEINKSLPDVIEKLETLGFKLTLEHIV